MSKLITVPIYPQPSYEDLAQVFRPHQFASPDEYIDLYHVYDNLSQTPYIRGIGIQCADPDEYFLHAWNAITPKAILEQLDWKNEQPTQLICFHGDLQAARKELRRRQGEERVWRDKRPLWRNPQSVRIANVRIRRSSKVWAFSKQELLRMMQVVGGPGFQIDKLMGRNEWMVWGNVPDDCVVQIL